jgi:hypothetical protein
MPNYFPHIVRGRACSLTRARIPKVSHFSITAALQISDKSGVLIIISSGMSSDQLDASGLNRSPVRTQVSRRMRPDSFRAWLLSIASSLRTWHRGQERPGEVALAHFTVVIAREACTRRHKLLRWRHYSRRSEICGLLGGSWRFIFLVSRKLFVVPVYL